MSKCVETSLAESEDDLLYNTHIDKNKTLSHLQVSWTPIEDGDKLIKVNLNYEEIFKADVDSGTKINLDQSNEKTRLLPNTSHPLELLFNNNIKGKNISVYATFTDSSVIQYNIHIE